VGCRIGFGGNPKKPKSGGWSSFWFFASTSLSFGFGCAFNAMTDRAFHLCPLSKQETADAKYGRPVKKFM
jgi:hypothetical protein